MNLDLLISKYIDGELTESEDEILREMIANQPYAKEVFERAINVHLLIKEDSTLTQTPPEIKSVIRNYIISNNQIDSQKSESLKIVRFNKFTKLMPVLLLLITIVFRIDNASNDYTSLNSDSDNKYVQLNSQKVKESPYNEKPKKIQSIYHSGKKELQIAKTENLPEIMDLDTYEKFSPAEPTSEINLSLIDENNLYTTLNEGLSSGMQTILINPQISTIRNEINSMEQMFFSISNSKNLSNYDIVINSFLFSELYSSESNNQLKVLTNLSQSISYSINNSERMGIEIGFREYSYKENFLVSIPISALPANVQVEIMDHSSEKHFTYQSEVEQIRKIFWGAAFYELTIFKTNNLTFDARLGIGSSNDGAIVYNRILSKYELISDLSLNFGFSSMLFQTNTAILNKQLQRAFSLTYGIQFKF